MEKPKEITEPTIKSSEYIESIDPSTMTKEELHTHKSKLSNILLPPLSVTNSLQMAIERAEIVVGVIQLQHKLGLNPTGDPDEVFDMFPKRMLPLDLTREITNIAMKKSQYSVAERRLIVLADFIYRARIEARDNPKPKYDPEEKTKLFESIKNMVSFGKKGDVSAHSHKPAK